jgi:DNA-binding PadR family transcriptional regulator
MLLSEPTRDDWYALQICRTTKLGSGTVVQVLFRIEKWGWVESRWEEEAAAHEDGRPRRRFYALTALGARGARRLIDDRLPKLLRFKPA